MGACCGMFGGFMSKAEQCRYAELRSDLLLLEMCAAAD